MLEILKYALDGFWRFIGFASILYVCLFFGVNGIINLFKAIRK